MAPHSEIAERRLYVDGQEFLLLGAETHNSSTSTLEGICSSFEAAAQAGANTVLAAVAWNQFEPVEGEFAFELADHMLATAAGLGLRLVPLWFGSYKNGKSSYVPDWVKTDLVRFPRAEVEAHRRIEHLSPFSPESVRADSTAFAAFMERLAVSEHSDVVILVQVENEPGLLGDSRDRSRLASARHESLVPRDVIEVVAANPQMPAHDEWTARGSLAEGTWAEVFGKSDTVDELFMAVAYAEYVEQVAEQGRRRFDVPLVVNAWLDVAYGVGVPSTFSDVAGGKRPGVYPSGGPVARVAPIWRALAPSIDVIGPDIYFGDFRAICEQYRRASDAFMIPEMRSDAGGIAQMFLAIGEYEAVGVSPFGVDSLAPGSLAHEQLQDAYRLLRSAHEILRSKPDPFRRGFLLETKGDSAELRLDGCTLHVEPHAQWGSEPVLPAYGLAIQEAPNQIIVIGRGFSVRFHADDGQVGILSARELVWTGERLIDGRLLNGDETSTGTVGRFPGFELSQGASPIPKLKDMPGIVRFRLYNY